MSQSSTAFNGQFGKRREPHRVIIAKGSKIKSFTIRPWLAGTLGFLVVIVSFGYFSATGYLVFRDRWLDTTAEQQRSLQASYETRIEALRTRIDQVSSTKAVQTEIMSQRLRELQNMRNQISARSAQLASMLAVAKSYGLRVNPMAIPTPKPTRQTEQKPEYLPASDQAALSAPLTGHFHASAPTLVAAPTDLVSAADINQALHLEIKQAVVALNTYAAHQRQALEIVELVAEQESKDYRKILKLTGLKRKVKPDTSAQGGPFIPADVSPAGSFSTQLDATMRALAYYKAMKQTVKELPLARPLSTLSHKVSSNFGVRRDPFHRRRAFHSGMDFKAAQGTPVGAAGVGKITRVGRNGGYGLTVDIDHGNGVLTRYAHLSRALVKVGQQVRSGQHIGKVGSTGRSTGPHLHYEVRIDNRAVDPRRFLRAGDQLRQTL